MPVDHKTPVQDIDGTPVKRVILSIIADYDLKTGLCELVDNAIDQWSDRKYSGALTVALDSVTYGDLDGDGVEEAVVSLNYSTNIRRTAQTRMRTARSACGGNHHGLGAAALAPFFFLFFFLAMISSSSMGRRIPIVFVGKSITWPIEAFTVYAPGDIRSFCVTIRDEFPGFSACL